jgi:glutathione S-transferase
MKYYYSKGACSLSGHAALIEAGIPFEIESVDLKTKRTESGADFLTINAKGYVPAMVLDSGETVTENIAVLDWIATRNPAVGLKGDMGRTRLLVALAYVSTEVHKNFEPVFHGVDEITRQKAGKVVSRRLQLLSDQMTGDYLFGDDPTVADFYLFVMTLWADKFAVAVPEPLVAFRQKMMARPSVQAALRAERII